MNVNGNGCLTTCFLIFKNKYKNYLVNEVITINFFFNLTLHSYYSNIKQTKNKIILSVFKRFK